jgi:hypothetical protein
VAASTHVYDFDVGAGTDKVRDARTGTSRGSGA